MVQEYGRYFGMKTGWFRGGCLTGPTHSGTELHGFLSYLMLCTGSGDPTGFRIQGKTGPRQHSQPRSGRSFGSSSPRAPAKSTTSAAAATATARCSKPSKCANRSAAKNSTGPTRNQPHRRPHLVDQRRAQIPGALSGLEISLRDARNPRKDSSPQLRDDRVRPRRCSKAVRGLMPDDQSAACEILHEAQLLSRGDFGVVYPRVALKSACCAHRMARRVRPQRCNDLNTPRLRPLSAAPRDRRSRRHEASLRAK